MSTTMRSLGIDQLSFTERILMVEEIRDSIIDVPEEVPRTEAEKLELDARLTKYEVDPHAGAACEEVKARLWGHQ